MSTDSTPHWFIEAIAQRPERGTVTVDGARVAVRSWGARSSPAVVLVHGSAAHAGWWDHIAPLLAIDRHVVAIDLSGHGDSDRRDGYSVDGWAAEVDAVSRSLGLRGPRVLVGHSMGAFVVLRAAGRASAEVEGVLAVDPPVRRPQPQDLARRAAIVAASPRVYATRDEAVSRWRPMPAQDMLACVGQHVADGSVRRIGEGWGWAFDQGAFDRPEIAPDGWTPLDCEVAVVRAEHGMLSPQMAEQLVAQLGPRARLTEIADAGHHVMLDHPLPLVAAVQSLLARVGVSAPAVTRSSAPRASRDGVTP